MTPKEKAIDLVDRYYSLFSLELENTIDITQAKECALIAVDEILNYDIKAKSEAQFVIQKRIEDYWNEVKQEIENL